MGSPTTKVPNAGGVGQNWQLLTNNSLYVLYCCFGVINNNNNNNNNSKTSTIASVVNLVRSYIYHTERPPLFAAHLPWVSALCGIVSDGWYLCKYWQLCVCECVCTYTECIPQGSYDGDVQCKWLQGREGNPSRCRRQWPGHHAAPLTGRAWSQAATDARSRRPSQWHRMTRSHTCTAMTDLLTPHTHTHM